MDSCPSWKGRCGGEKVYLIKKQRENRQELETTQAFKGLCLPTYFYQQDSTPAPKGTRQQAFKTWGCGDHKDPNSISFARETPRPYTLYFDASFKDLIYKRNSHSVESFGKWPKRAYNYTFLSWRQWQWFDLISCFLATCWKLKSRVLLASYTFSVKATLVEIRITAQITMTHLAQLNWHREAIGGKWLCKDRSRFWRTK